MDFYKPMMSGVGRSEEVMNARLAKPTNVYSKYEVNVGLLAPKEYCYFLF